MGFGCVGPTVTTVDRRWRTVGEGRHCEVGDNGRRERTSRWRSCKRNWAVQNRLEFLQLNKWVGHKLLQP